MLQSKIDKTPIGKISTTIGTAANIEVQAKTVDRPTRAVAESPEAQGKTSQTEGEKAERATLFV